jgi:hypothetical protein
VIRHLVTLCAPVPSCRPASSRAMMEISRGDVHLQQNPLGTLPRTLLGREVVEIVLRAGGPPFCKADRCYRDRRAAPSASRAVPPDRPPSCAGEAGVFLGRGGEFALRRSKPSCAI